MERQPKLTSKELPQDRRVPRDGLLRGASAEEVIGGGRAWLANERPSHRGVIVTLAANEEAIRRVEQRWRRLCRKNGSPEHLACRACPEKATAGSGEARQVLVYGQDTMPCVKVSPPR